jgi:hypothetical protein
LVVCQINSLRDFLVDYHKEGITSCRSCCRSSACRWSRLASAGFALGRWPLGRAWPGSTGPRATGFSWSAFGICSPDRQLSQRHRRSQWEGLTVLFGLRLVALESVRVDLDRVQLAVPRMVWAVTAELEQPARLSHLRVSLRVPTRETPDSDGQRGRS